MGVRFGPNTGLISAIFAWLNRLKDSATRSRRRVSPNGKYLSARRSSCDVTWHLNRVSSEPERPGRKRKGVGSIGVQARQRIDRAAALGAEDRRKFDMARRFAPSNRNRLAPV